MASQLSNNQTSDNGPQSLFDTLKELVPEKQERLKQFVRRDALPDRPKAHGVTRRKPSMGARSLVKSRYAPQSLGLACVYTLRPPQVENLIGGMRGLKALLWEGSVLDPNEVRAYPMLSPKS